ncbi:unnamed protein product [Cladocopium goreaui]|uniref:Uncharacterized protein n=1 Tax=Cladocopium goreaui TaxID=2562237 RepID=A0A9P1CBK8_9DINO|nr:unnamed protein product [Cladocopium goreaui]
MPKLAWLLISTVSSGHMTPEDSGQCGNEAESLLQTAKKNPFLSLAELNTQADQDKKQDGELLAAAELWTAEAVDEQHDVSAEPEQGDVASNEFCAENNMTTKHEKHEENDVTVDAKDTDTAASQEGAMTSDTNVKDMVKSKSERKHKKDRKVKKDKKIKKNKTDTVALLKSSADVRDVIIFQKLGRLRKMLETLIIFQQQGS